ncbi:MAG: hypothetical protein AB8B91_11615 [Rubripirellula sp.]
MHHEALAIFSVYLEPFSDLEPLRSRVQDVLEALPKEVQQDFLTDSRFTVSLDNYAPGKGSMVFMAPPGTDAAGAQTVSRCVVLKPKLADCSREFATYVIAHEFAHAFLRNGPWGEITDIEEAADALAASWGFPKPASRWRVF